jgi:5'-nucleotidase
MYKQMDDSTLIANTSGIDLVLGGHTHTYFQELQYVKNAEGKDVPVDQNGKHGIFIGKQRLFIQSKE